MAVKRIELLTGEDRACRIVRICEIDDLGPVGYGRCQRGQVVSPSRRTGQSGMPLRGSAPAPKPMKADSVVRTSS